MDVLPLAGLHFLDFLLEQQRLTHSGGHRRGLRGGKISVRFIEDKSIAAASNLIAAEKRHLGDGIIDVP